MTKDQQIDIEKIINEAFEIYYLINSSVASSTIKENKKRLQNFILYIRNNELTHELATLSQIGFNNYRDYLIKMKKNGEMGVNRVNQLCELIQRLINKVLVVESKYASYRFSHVSFNKLRDTRSKGERGSNFPLINEEIKAIAKCDSLSESEKEYRIVFL